MLKFTDWLGLEEPINKSQNSKLGNGSPGGVLKTYFKKILKKEEKEVTLT